MKHLKTYENQDEWDIILKHMIENIPEPKPEPEPDVYYDKYIGCYMYKDIAFNWNGKYGMYCGIKDDFDFRMFTNINYEKIKEKTKQMFKDVGGIIFMLGATHEIVKRTIDDYYFDKEINKFNL